MTTPITTPPRPPLDGKVALVAGASRGIGEATARAFARAGAAVVLAARDKDALEHVAEGIRADGSQALAVPTDVGEPASVERLVARAEETFGRLDAAFNNATDGLPGFTLFSYHADPVIIEPSGKRGDAPAIDRLQSRRLLYLGQANGTAVVYDPCAKRATYIPLASAILHVARSPRLSEQEHLPPC